MEVLADMHVHSTFSVDAKDSMDIMCENAIKKGLKYICFTEHVDINPCDYGYKYFNFDKYSTAIESSRAEFAEQICILKGIEFSEPHLYLEEFEYLKAQDFDVILASIHWIGDKFVGQSELLSIFSKEELFKRYYELILEMVSLGGFDILAHFDFPKRYLGRSYENLEIIDTILYEVVKKEIALEINTSSLRKGMKESSPDFSVLSRYIKAGGKRITIGSDAHSYSEIAADFSYAHDLIKRFPELILGVYKKRTFIPIK